MTIASLLLLGFVLAYWTWVWVAPRIEPRQDIAPEAAVRLVSASTLFGSVQREGNAAATTGLAIKLHGVMAGGKGQKGYAVLQLDGKQSLAVHEGEDVSPGVRLAEVHSDHVILERNGTREKLPLPEKNGVTPSPGPNTTNKSNTTNVPSLSSVSSSLSTSLSRKD